MRFCLTLIAAVVVSAALPVWPARPHAGGNRPAKRPRLEFDASVINNAYENSPLEPGADGSAVVRLQIELDRLKFSPGEIDGRFSGNTEKALIAFQLARGLPQQGAVDAPAWQQLNADSSAALVQYTITSEDLAGPFMKIPADMMAKARLRKLGYSSPVEELAERFHSSPRLLVALNRGKRFDRAGEQILVPNVLTPPPAPAAQIVVSASESSVEALDAEGHVLSHYPATIGSEHDPLPVGDWKILGVRKDPVFYYNPNLFWDAKPGHAKAKIQPGPNNPVGVVWIDLSKEHYGIHGTAEPSSIGRAQSHGCIRLTNWDAWELAGIVKPGTPAILKP